MPEIVMFGQAKVLGVWVGHERSGMTWVSLVSMY